MIFYTIAYTGAVSIMTIETLNGMPDSIVFAQALYISRVIYLGSWFVSSRVSMYNPQTLFTVAGLITMTVANSIAGRYFLMLADVISTAMMFVAVVLDYIGVNRKYSVTAKNFAPIMCGGIAHISMILCAVRPEYDAIVAEVLPIITWIAIVIASDYRSPKCWGFMLIILVGAAVASILAEFDPENADVLIGTTRLCMSFIMLVPAAE